MKIGAHTSLNRIDSTSVAHSFIRRVENVWMKKEIIAEKSRHVLRCLQFEYMWKGVLITIANDIAYHRVYKMGLRILSTGLYSFLFLSPN